MPPFEEMQVESDTLCVLYDRDTGKIALTHRVITLAGGEVRDQASIETAARDLAAGRGRDVAALEALHTGGDTMDQPGVYSVKVRTGELLFQTFEEAGIDLGIDIDIGLGGLGRVSGGGVP